MSQMSTSRQLVYGYNIYERDRERQSFSYNLILRIRIFMGRGWGLEVHIHIFLSWQGLEAFSVVIGTRKWRIYNIVYLSKTPCVDVSFTLLSGFYLHSFHPTYCFFSFLYWSLLSSFMLLLFDILLHFLDWGFRWWLPMEDHFGSLFLIFFGTLKDAKHKFHTYPTMSHR